jgi:hypothetical protein
MHRSGAIIPASPNPRGWQYHLWGVRRYNTCAKTKSVARLSHMFGLPRGNWEKTAQVGFFIEIGFRLGTHSIHHWGFGLVDAFEFSILLSSDKSPKDLEHFISAIKVKFLHSERISVSQKNYIPSNSVSAKRVLLTAYFHLSLFQIFWIFDLYSYPAPHKNHTPNPHGTIPPIVMISSSTSADHDALPRTENFLCIKSEIQGNIRSRFHLKIFKLAKMKDAFSSRSQMYGYPASNPEILSVPISSHFLDLWKFRGQSGNWSCRYGPSPVWVFTRCLVRE